MDFDIKAFKFYKTQNFPISTTIPKFLKISNIWYAGMSTYDIPPAILKFETICGVPSCGSSKKVLLMLILKELTILG